MCKSHLKDSAMVFTVEFVRTRVPPVSAKERDSGNKKPRVRPQGRDIPPLFYSCSGKIWERALQVAQQNSWTPMGTLPSSSSLIAWFKSGELEYSYEPEAWQYAKTVVTADALALADALEKGLQIAPDDPDDATPDTYFLTFLRGGSFEFAWDD